MRNILDKTVSFYSKFGDGPQDANLFELLTGDRYKNEVEKVRDEKLFGDEEYKKAKQRLPMFTVSGTFAGAGASTLKQHSGLICVDIDEADNQELTDFARLKESIKAVPFVAFAAHSVGDRGFYCIVPISSPAKHKQHFESLYKAFKRCGIIIDRSGCDVSRKRFVSFDDEPYINQDAQTYDRLCQEHLKPALKDNNRYFCNAPGDVDALIREIRRTHKDISGNYQQWFSIGCALSTEFGESGRQYFHDISEHYPGYDYRETDSKYNDCMKTRGAIGIGTLFHYAKEAGLTAAVDFANVGPVR